MSVAPNHRFDPQCPRASLLGTLVVLLLGARSTETLALMSEPSLFGFGKAQWDLVNGFANWFAAIGSFAAAAVALFIANRSAKPTATLSVGHRILIGPGSTKPYPEFAVFRIVNTGDRPIRIIQIGWRTGLFRKRFAVQMYEPMQSSTLPVDLTHADRRQIGMCLCLLAKSLGLNILRRECFPRIIGFPCTR